MRVPDVLSEENQQYEELSISICYSYINKLVHDMSE